MGPPGFEPKISCVTVDHSNHVVKELPNSEAVRNGTVTTAVRPRARKKVCKLCGHPWQLQGDVTAGIFLCQLYSALSQSKIEQKLPKMMNYISNRQFGENSMKFRPKVGTLQMFKFTAWCKVMQHIKLYTNNLLFGMEILFI